MPKHHLFYAALGLVVGMLWGVSIVTVTAAIAPIEKRLESVRASCRLAGGEPEDIVNTEIVTAIYCSLWPIYQRTPAPEQK